MVAVEHNPRGLNAGLKSEAYVPPTSSRNDQGEIEVRGRLRVRAADAIENGYGDKPVARQGCCLVSWLSLETAWEFWRLRDR